MSRSPYYYAYPPAPHNYIGMSHANRPVMIISRPMPQQPLPAPPLNTQGRQTRSRPTKAQDRRKRYGVIFNTDPLRGMLNEEDDDDSTWSMSRSRSSHRMLYSRRRTSMKSRNSSPAQDIAARYRASNSESERFGASSSDITYLQVPSVDRFSMGSRQRTTSGETNLSDVSGPRLRYRDSRAHAMDRATREAYLMAVQNGGYRNIPCQRSGCRDILPTIRDLASHITLHDIDPRERYLMTPRYSSFIDMGHSAEGRPRRRYVPSPAPYARSNHSRSKFRRYLSKLTYPCIPCHFDNGDDDFF